MNYYDKHPDIGFVYTNFWYCDENLKKHHLGYCQAIPTGKTNLEMNCVSHFKTFRKSIYYKTDGYNEKILYAGDKDIILKIEEITKLHFIDKPLYFYRVLSQSHGEKRLISKKNFNIAKQESHNRRKTSNRVGLINFFIHLSKNINTYIWRGKKKPKLTHQINKDIAIENLITAKKYWIILI